MGIDVVTGKNGTQIYVCTEPLCHAQFPRREDALLHRIDHSDERFAENERQRKAMAAYEAGAAFADTLKLLQELEAEDGR